MQLHGHWRVPVRTARMLHGVGRELAVRARRKGRPCRDRHEAGHQPGHALGMALAHGNGGPGQLQDAWSVVAQQRRGTQVFSGIMKSMTLLVPGVLSIHAGCQKSACS